MKKIIALLSLAAFAFAAVDINSASVEELTKVKGLGKAKATAIVDYRKTKCFDNVDELAKVKGLGAKSVEGMKKELEAKPCKK
ncbi:MAG TPA: helix-hairpin-helix domain-containing protein [Campylobacterales bacterium]|nr:helix-hairpin-helix domain-containing protein [Campylobacterales bacterium]